MERVIMIKYGELTTKKGNRNFFVNSLYKSILNKLKNYDVIIYKDLSRMYIEFDEKKLNDILKKINKIFGIHKYNVAYKINSSISEIEKSILEIIKKEDFNTFKVETKRSDKKFQIKSIEFNNVIGGLLLKNIDNISVDVHNPDYTLKIEIRENYTYIYSKEIKGAGGYPTGVAGRGILMLSGGIDSPVSGYLAMKRGIKVECLYFESPPHTSQQALNKVKKLVNILSEYQPDIKLHVINFTNIQENIYKNINSEYMITIMRRMMYRIADIVRIKRHALVIINGESVGQVASQTLNSMSVINNVTNTPIIRPVACLDKLEIIDIAKKIGTYDVSILPYEDCCTIFLPKHPVINPRLDKCIEYEKTFDYNTLIKNSVDNISHVDTAIDNKFNF